MDDDTIIRTRLAVDERPLRRLVKKYSLYTSQLGKLSEKEDMAMYESLQLELANFEMTSTRSQFVHDMNGAEQEGYREAFDRIEKEHTVTEAEIQQLQLQLEAAQQERANKIEYDRLANRINKFATKDAQREAIDKLQQELKSLSAEKSVYADTWIQRKAQFATIIKTLHDLQAQIRQEKEQVEQKDRMAMLEGDADADGEADADNKDNADGHGSSVATPEASGPTDPSSPAHHPSQHDPGTLSSQRLNVNASEFKPRDPSKLHSSMTLEEGEEDDSVNGMAVDGAHDIDMNDA